MLDEVGQIETKTSKEMAQSAHARKFADNTQQIKVYGNLINHCLQNNHPL